MIGREKRHTVVNSKKTKMTFSTAAEKDFLEQSMFNNKLFAITELTPTGCVDK